MTVAGFTSTGSKRPHVLFGPAADGVPLRMERSLGCTVHTADGHVYTDFIMALGAVALGYGYTEVNEAVIDAVDRGTVGPLAPEDELMLSAELGAVMPWLEKVRFLKTGAEAVAAAVRIARVATGREAVLGCGYHGWLDWCSDAAGVPDSTRHLYDVLPFNDPQRTLEQIRGAGDRLACVVVEPVVDAPPSSDWLAVLRSEVDRVGAVLIFDEVKTAFRIALGGAAEKWGVHPDLSVLGKAIANGYPLAVVGGRRALMDFAQTTWISSTLATEFVSLAAARATVAVQKRLNVPRLLESQGSRLLKGLRRLADTHADLGIQAAGVPHMCHLQYRDEAMSQRVAVACARRGLLFKRSGYNFVSLAHDDATIDRALDILDDALSAC
jgi:glutamate-1-semialdehyde 2,1-aminomutase